MAVGLSVAIVALAGYLTVRHQLYASIDDSLLHRARPTRAKSGTLERHQADGVPPWLPGAADVHDPAAVRQRRVQVQRHARVAATTHPCSGEPELAVARGDEHWTCRTIVTQQRRPTGCAVPVPGERRQRARPRAVAGARTSRRSTSSAWCWSSSVARGDRGRPSPAGASRATACARCAAHRRPPRRSPAPRSSTRSTVEGNDEIARLVARVQPMLAALAASRDRQRQLVADAGHELRTPLTSLRTNLDLLTQAERGAASPRPRGPSCSTTCGSRSRS